MAGVSNQSEDAHSRHTAVIGCIRISDIDVSSVVGIRKSHHEYVNVNMRVYACAYAAYEA